VTTSKQYSVDRDGYGRVVILFYADDNYTLLYIVLSSNGHDALFIIITESFGMSE